MTDKLTDHGARVKALTASITRLETTITQKSEALRYSNPRDPFAIHKASVALTQKIVTAARERLPAAIAEFDVGGLVRQKVSDYPIEKLEALVLSVAQQHLKTIELFGAFIGLWIGVGQAIYFWFTYAPKH